jgi:hypothetical protein
LSSHDDNDKEFRKPEYGKVDFDRQVGEKHGEETGEVTTNKVFLRTTTKT